MGTAERGAGDDPWTLRAQPVSEPLWSGTRTGATPDPSAVFSEPDRPPQSKTWRLKKTLLAIMIKYFKCNSIIKNNVINIQLFII